MEKEKGGIIESLSWKSIFAAIITFFGFFVLLPEYAFEVRPLFVTKLGSNMVSFIEGAICGSITTILVLKAYSYFSRGKKPERKTSQQERKLVKPEFIREGRFLKRLDNLLEDFNSKIVNITNTYSLTSIASRIANDKIIRQHNITWELFLSHFNEDLAQQGNILHGKVKQRKGEFTSLFKDFISLISLLRKFKNQFYKMVADTKKIHCLSSDSEFKRTYKKFRERFNKYMDRLDFFSDEVKAEFGLSLREGLTEHVKNLEELYGS